ncbi:cardioacceleratory peptide receptor-like isoform X2 [Cimex lectularius]|uniref:G-protein coupled receptors family 1 profile domain-containing protein n=1 Tax=Cimex lectularius TaxID=79782 RepID=A0A8I6RPS3_CIMLE|nr:cardioacceleratory peptide receptor-like isoform X2 [Cimex lectularius]XP_014248904.1 cardioacceleratory peptide receptor-like isoform X2 [Cimex lectularius]
MDKNKSITIMDWVIRDNYTNPELNATSTSEEINSFYFYQTEQFTVLWLLFAAIVLGNSAVLLALLFSKTSKSRMNFFIMHLALADLSVGLISVLTDIIWRITVAWKAGNTVCKLVRFMQAVVTYSSTYVLVALSLDRLDAITRPMNFSGSWRRARLLVGFAWSLSAVFSSPILFLYEERLIQGSAQCWIELGSSFKWQLYMSLVALTLFLIPAVVITGCYTVIVYTIWTKSVHITRDSQQSTPLKNGDKHDENDIRRASSRGIIPRAKIKTVKMTFVIVFVFILCWSPYIVFDLLQVFGYVPRTQTNIAVATFIQSLAPLNSAANPVIYCLFSTHICRALGKLPPFSWICCCLVNRGNESSSIIDTVTSTLRRATVRNPDNL